MLSRALLLRTLRLSSLHPRTSTTHLKPPTRNLPHRTLRQASHASSGTTARHLNIASPADAAIDQITELYATARDEFEIALEETEKVSVYAESDRQAAREELSKVQQAYAKAVEGEYGEEVRRRVGHRIRELEQGVAAMEEMVQHQD